MIPRRFHLGKKKKGEISIGMHRTTLCPGQSPLPSKVFPPFLFRVKARSISIFPSETCPDFATKKFYEGQQKRGTTRDAR